MPQQIGTSTMQQYLKEVHFLLNHVYGCVPALWQNLVGVPTCSGMGATNLAFKARTDFRSVTKRKFLQLYIKHNHVDFQAIIFQQYCPMIYEVILAWHKKCVTTLFSVNARLGCKILMKYL